MGWGRLFEFPPETPEFTEKPTVSNIAAFVLAHAVEIV